MKRSIVRNVAQILFVLVLLSSLLGASAVPQKKASAQAATPPAAGIVTDTWAVQVQPGTDPNVLAQQMGAQNLGQIGALDGYYLFRIPGTDSEVTGAAGVFAASGQVLWFEQQVKYQQSKRVVISDPQYPNQWHLNNATIGEVDANTMPAWDGGYTGTGVNIAVVDDGLEATHPDISGNYNATGSWDFVTYDVDGGDSDPSPALAGDNHGTPVGGVAAANNDGSSCGVGVAYDAGLSGIRLISVGTSDTMEAVALSYQKNVNHIYSSSWGPTDGYPDYNDLSIPWDLRGPGTLTLQALENGVATGRSNKGSIYVWAGGNGGGDGDNVNYDGYANSRYVIAVGAVTNTGVQSGYSEPGAPLLVVAPSDGGSKYIVSTDRSGTAGYNFAGDCVTNFGGTSSTAPLVSGIVALMLQRNPNLGWRDVQNILARTAVQNDAADAGWTTNSAGLHINHKYGFGLVDAEAAVAMANPATYVNLGSEVNLSSALDAPNSGAIPPGLDIPDNDLVKGIERTIYVNQNINVERAVVTFNSTHTYRGDLRLVLTAPSGTQSVLAEAHGDPGDDFSNWTFSSVRHWGELSAGNWTLKVTDEFGGDVGKLVSWKLDLYGALPAAASVFPDDLNFGNQMYRTSNPAQTVTVTNINPASITLGTISATNTDFIIGSDLCSNQILVQDATCTFNVTYLSNALGLDSGTITIPSTAPDSPYLVALFGNAIPGTQLLLNRSFENFGPDLLPTSWTLKLISPGGPNMVDSSWAFHLTHSMKLVGDSTLKQLTQVINKPGVAGDDFQIFVVAKGQNVPLADPALTPNSFRAQIRFFDGVTVVDRRTISFNIGSDPVFSFTDKRISIAYTAKADYTSLEYNLVYGKDSGTGWFDLASLQWAP